MRYIILSACLLLALNTMAQQKTWRKDTVIDGKTFSYVEQMPAPDYNFNKYLSKHLHYPDSARKYNIEGRVIVRFIVTETGEIEGVKALNEVGGGCEEEAVRVLTNMPPWSPGKQNGKPVRVYFTQPITFKLTD